MTAQIVEISGQKIAMLPIADYEQLLRMAEEQADADASDRAERRRLDGEEYIPFELVNAIIEGENALRAWRKYRGISQAHLAEMAKVRTSTVSELEGGKAQGKPAVWRALADVLDVSVDDILPFE